LTDTGRVLAVLATALFSTIALLGTALFALLGQINSFRGEVNSFRGEFNAFRGEFNVFRGEVAGEFATIKADIARIEQKLDDHLASPHPAG
jgi:hypothetical protein